HSIGGKNSIVEVSQNFNVNWGRWATNFNSSPWPVSTRSITACFNWREAIAIEEWRLMRNCKRRSSRAKSMGAGAPSTGAKWARATSTTSLRLSPLACSPPRRCEVQPNKNSFIEPGRDGFVGSRGFNRQPPGRALRRGGAERVPRLHGALRRDHAAGARSFSGARLARQLQRRRRETASLFARARWPNESRRKLVGCAFA